MSKYGYSQAKRARDDAYKRKGGMTVGLPKATMPADHLALFIKEYEALERTQISQWVSVEERLPEFNVRVWVWDGEIAGTDVSNNILGTKVTHWMPLPAPPSQEQESGG